MIRNNTLDHIMFDECIFSFRNEHQSNKEKANSSSVSYILTSFNITQKWELGICTVYPSEQIKLSSSYSAFVCKVDNPSWVGYSNIHLFGIALSAIISCITYKPCKAPRDDFWWKKESLTDDDLVEIGLSYPILVAGSGFYVTNIPEAKLLKYEEETREFIELLFSINYDKYMLVMQSIRLAHLSLINLRDDFGLAYLLIVSAIETIAQKAVSRNKVKKHEFEDKWKEKAKNDPLISSLYENYKESRGNNKYLNKRYVKFILSYAPIENWKSYVEHPLHDVADLVRSSEHNLDNFVKKNPNEVYPDNLKAEQIKNVLSNSYKYRSSFVHEGKQPPHFEPHSMTSRFFDSLITYDNELNKPTQMLLPKYTLLVGLFKFSLTNWLKNT